MRQINLLPSELKPSKQASILVKKAEKTFILLLVFYLIALGAAFASERFLKNKLVEAKDRKSVLSNELKSLVNVETATVYIRDRIEKYNTLIGKDIELTTFKNFEESMAFFPGDALIKSVEISENTITYSVSVTTLSSLSQCIDGLIRSGLYKEATLSGLAYRTQEGYMFDLTLSF